MVSPGSQDPPSVVLPQPKKPGKHRLTGSLLALGSLAVASVYTVGYASTQSSIDDLTAQLEVTPLATTSSTAGAAATSTAPAVTQPAAASVEATTATAGTDATPVTSEPTATVAASRYADGTYTGTGNSRHGSITVTVVVEGGEIVSAAVSDCQTRYPCSDVNPLVSAVLTNQEVPVDNVSGATDSSRAYRAAVTGALQQALVG